METTDNMKICKCGHYKTDHNKMHRNKATKEVYWNMCCRCDCLEFEDI